MGLRGEESGEDVSNDSTDAVLGEDIESIIDSDDEFQLGGIVASSSTNNTVDDSSPRRDLKSC